MNVYFLLITILLRKISTLYSEEIQKIIIANNISTIQHYRYFFKTKGVQLIFDQNSLISVIPTKIQKEFLENGFLVNSPTDTPFIEQMDNGYSKLKSIFNDNYSFPAVNIILKNYGVTFPTNYLFKDSDGDYYEIIFLSHKDAENIIIGKDLIELMDVSFENGIEIRNKDFVIKLNDG